MSLRLRQAIAGRPSTHSSQNAASLRVGEKGYIVYPSSSDVVVLEPNLELAETLLFWSALPHRSASSKAEVQGVLGDSANGLVIAWTDVHVVVWQQKSAKGVSSWVVHSTVLASAQIKCLDFCKGNLVLGTTNGIEFWHTQPDADVVVWDKLWDRPYPSISTIKLSPQISHIAWFTQSQRSAFVLGLDRKGHATGIPQEIRHPREIDHITWRNSPATNSDAYLYTITTNQVFRIYAPVLDDPTWFQLLATLDSRSFLRSPTRGSAKGKEVAHPAFAGAIWPIDANVLHHALQAELEGMKQGKIQVKGESRKIIESLLNEEGDLVMWLGQDGTIALRSLINIDRKPPTLLKSLPVARSSLSLPLPWSGVASTLFAPDSDGGLLAITQPTDISPGIRAVKIRLDQLLASEREALQPVTTAASAEQIANVLLRSDIDHFVRTPNGRGLLAIGETGEIGVWYKDRLGKVAKGASSPKVLLGKGQWTESTKPKECAIFAKGRAMVMYTQTPYGGSIQLQHLDPDASTPTPAVTLPDFELEMGDDVEMLLAVSDIDDGFSGRGRRTQRAIIMAASRDGHAWVWRVDSRLISRTSTDSTTDDGPEIKLLSHFELPTEGGKPHMILPVDPMGWHQSVIDWKNKTPLQDMVLTVSKEGVLEFWSPELGHHYEGERPHSERHKGCVDHSHLNGTGHSHENAPWRRTGVVRTGRKDVLIARCSSRKKTALICENDQGYEMTIWDSNVSEFSTGLELTHIFDSGDKVQDLDWTTTSDLQSVLAVGFPHQVVLVCEQRLSYSEATPGWAPFLSINLERYTSEPISDSIWLAGGSLAIGAGNQIYLFSRFIDRDTPVSSPAASIKSVVIDSDEPEDIFQLIAHQNGPLWDYHPTVLGQCLLWNKIDLVKAILVDLAVKLKAADEEGRKKLIMKRMDPVDFLAKKAVKKAEIVNGAKKYDSLFSSILSSADDIEDDDDFNEGIVRGLVDRLNGPIVLPMSSNERSQLATLAQATLEVERERRSLDICGLRYLISLRMLVNQSRLSGGSGTITPSSASDSLIQPKLSFRNYVWAMHSESQDLLLQAATQTCDSGKMFWPEAKRLGVFLWLKSSETIKSQLEVIARNRFMADDDRDPTSCSLIFFALNKKKVVHGLWRQAPGHREQPMMLKFLANDFELDRWKTAAIKNAYALLSKQRYEYAASFFMLGGCPKDAINVCLRHLDDWQLAFALARVVEGGTDGPLVKWILTDTVVPLSMAGGHRWLATWAFWTLGRRDLAVRVLISPMTEVADSWSEDVLDVGNPENDDPSLLLLFQHLKSKSLQTAKGTSEIPEKTEFDFVLHNARVFFRMGCHALGLDLLHSWSFDRPFFSAPKSRIRTRVTTPAPSTPGSQINGTVPRRPSISPTISISGSSSFIRPPRRPSFMLSAHARRESMVMDMDPLVEGASEPVTRVGSPSALNGEIEEESDGEQQNNIDNKQMTETIEVKTAKTVKEDDEQEEQEEPPRKMGNLMKELKQDVQQGAMEFNMDSFGF